MTVERSGVLNIFNIRHKNRNYLLHNDDKDDREEDVEEGDNGRNKDDYTQDIMQLILYGLYKKYVIYAIIFWVNTYVKQPP